MWLKVTISSCVGAPPHLTGVEQQAVLDRGRFAIYVLLQCLRRYVFAHGLKRFKLLASALTWEVGK